MKTDYDLSAASLAFEAQDYVKALTILTALIDQAQTAEPFVLLGETLEKMGLIAEAAQAFEQAATHEAQTPENHIRRAAGLYFRNGAEDQAALHAIRLFKQDNRDTDAAFILASVFSKTGDQAIVDLVKNSLVESDDIAHLDLAAKLIGHDSRNENTVKLYEKLRRLRPDDQNIRFRLLDLAREFCVYDILECEDKRLLQDIENGDEGVLAWESPHTNLMWCPDERLNRIPENTFGVEHLLAGHAETRRRRPHTFAQKIRVGYLSSDFWDQHATMKLLQRVLQLHDLSQFEITLFCYTPENLIDADQGNRSTWGTIVSIGDMTDGEAAETIRASGVDILVDLKGHTGASRARILNRMIAPVQVAWLGFPGSSLHIDCDYIIGDTVVLPDSSKPFYHEKFCRLPDSYQPNDPVHRPLPQPASRSDWQLPQDAFVFAAFNATKKLSRETLTLWAGILRRVENSALWMMCDSPLAQSNVLALLSRQGISCERVIFARKVRYAEHLSRLPLADLALDTFPCNGHTTTSDLLWAGVPVVTARGSNFTSRVSESLLKAAGLSELVADDYNGFADLAVDLANDRDRLNALRAKLVAGRNSVPLFDAARFCRHLEAAFATMVERSKQGKPPAHFDVPPQEAS